MRKRSGKKLICSCLLFVVAIDSSCHANSFRFEKRNVGLLWVDTPDLSRKTRDKNKINKSIKSFVENQIGIPVIYDVRIPDLTESQWRIASKIEKLSRSARNLIKGSLKDENEGSFITAGELENEKSFLEKYLMRISKSDFGPEIQGAKVALAAFHWKKGNKKRTRELLSGALRLHPQGKIVTKFNTEFYSGEDFEAVVAGEKVERKGKECLLEWGNREEVHTAWVNGFLINPLPETIQEGLYHFIARNKQGYFSEKVVSCSGSVVNIDPLNWSEQIPGQRLDRYFSHYFPGLQNVLVLESKKEDILGFGFSGRGEIFPLSDIPLKWSHAFKSRNADVLSIWKKKFMQREHTHELPRAPSERLVVEKWYNNKWIWTLLGGVVTGSVLLKELNQSLESPPQEGRILFQSE